MPQISPRSARLRKTYLPGFVAKDRAQSFDSSRYSKKTEMSSNKRMGISFETNPTKTRSEADITAISKDAPKKIILKLQFSHRRADALKRYCHAEQLTELELICDVRTRFVLHGIVSLDAYERDRRNSTWEMLVRLQDLRPVIDLLTQRDPTLRNQLNDHDWLWIKRLFLTCQRLSSYPALSKQYPR
jgi:hypothetical protein